MKFIVVFFVFLTISCEYSSSLLNYSTGKKAQRAPDTVVEIGDAGIAQGFWRTTNVGDALDPFHIFRQATGKKLELVFLAPFQKRANEQIDWDFTKVKLVIRVENHNEVILSSPLIELMKKHKETPIFVYEKEWPERKKSTERKAEEQPIFFIDAKNSKIQIGKFKLGHRSAKLSALCSKELNDVCDITFNRPAVFQKRHLAIEVLNDQL